MITLTSPQELPEDVRPELEKLVGSLQAYVGVEHDADGRQRVTCAKWTLGADLSLTHNVLARVPVSIPASDNVPGLLTFVQAGIVRVGEPGAYQITAQVRFATSAAGGRGVQLKRNGIEVAFVFHATSGGVTWVQATETIVCAGGETIEVWGYQTSGGALNVESASGQTFLRIARVA